jgi:hypothetical protein
MTSHSDNGRMYRVRVLEQRSVLLSGLDGCEYSSPAHTAEGARRLLRVLLGCEPAPDQVQWLVPIAGGKRRIELVEAGDG